MGLIQRPKPTRLPEKLLQIRMALGLSQSGMIKQLGLAEPYDRSTISYYERGEREPPLPILLQYARAVGISTDVLIDDQIDLPKELLVGVRRERRESQQKQQSSKISTKAKMPMKTTILTLWLKIESKDKSARTEKRARKNIEKLLKKHQMKGITDVEYDLKFSYGSDEDLDKQVYSLLQEIADEAERQSCTAEFDVKEKNTERYW